MRIERNRNPSGKINSIGFGLCKIIDGLVGVLSLGFLYSNATLNYARNTSLKRLAIYKQTQENKL